MTDKELSKEEIATLSPDEAFEKLIGIIKEMSHDELVEFSKAIEIYKSLNEGTH